MRAMVATDQRARLRGAALARRLLPVSPHGRAVAAGARRRAADQRRPHAARGLPARRRVADHRARDLELRRGVRAQRRQDRRRCRAEPSRATSWPCWSRSTAGSRVRDIVRKLRMGSFDVSKMCLPPAAARRLIRRRVVPDRVATSRCREASPSRRMQGCGRALARRRLRAGASARAAACSPCRAPTAAGSPRLPSLARRFSTWVSTVRTRPTWR